MSKWLKILQELGYAGEFTTELSQRVVHAYDNSIYHKLPLAVCYPKNINDLVLLVQFARQQSLTITPQGGSTATVGQSLGTGLLLDLQRYMNNIIAIDLQAGWIEVEAGCSLKDMQKYLARHDYEFKVEISPNDRCTLAGMVSTNAVGIGGACFGRMSKNVLSLNLIMSDGSMFNTLDLKSDWHKRLSDILQQADQKIILEKQALIPRNIGGYDLAEYYKSNNLAAIFSGSEGTLGIIASIRCRIVPKKTRSLILLYHPQIQKALSFSEYFVQAGALAVEMLDANLCAAVRRLSPDIMPTSNKDEVILLIEHINPDRFLEQLPLDAWSSQVFIDEAEIQQIWGIRRSAVAIISKYSKNARRPLAMIEDTAVPPANLAGYISELRTYLGTLGLFYGMYGHVDAGCIHVRPALNLQYDRHLILQIVAKVKSLCEQFGGVFWGEHGIGYRTEFVQEFWGQEIYSLMQQIKQVCDPNFIFNPRKLVSSEPVGFADDWQPMVVGSEPWFACNGQAACLGDNSAVMCPSYRASGNKAWSPKGRAVMMRYWQLASPYEQLELAESIKNSMDKCLGCHACVSECPVSVNIPRAKAEFLATYYQNNSRSIRDYFWAKFERYLAYFARIKYRFYCRNSEFSDFCIMPDIWSYCFDYDIWLDLFKVLAFMKIKYKLIKPVALGQSPYNEGDMSEFGSLKRNVPAFDLFALEPSTINFASSALGKRWQDVASYLLKQNLSVTLAGDVVLLGHCTEQAKSSVWSELLRSLGINVTEYQLGCCGMAGSFGLKAENTKISKKLFSSWMTVLDSTSIVLATGFSCRMQARKFGYEVYHPVQYLASKLGEIYG